MRRLAWCVHAGRTPANEHVHEAPGDDGEFVYGVPPWTPDGRPNPPGVYTGRPTQNEQLLAELCRDSDAAGWSCHKCAAWIPYAPRKFRGGEEPYNWYWCMSCRQRFSKPPAKELKQQRLASRCCKITAFMQSAEAGPDM